MTANDGQQRAPAALTAAARTLLDCFAAGAIRVPASMMRFQRLEIERAMRIDSQILGSVAADDCAVIALTAIACIRWGIETGALVVAGEDAARHVVATIEGVAPMLAAAENASGPLASVWFDAPAVIPAA